MKILTWNIQATKGCDDRYDLNRIVDRIKNMGDLEVICLQEVSRNIPDLNADDQPALLASCFPDHESVWGPGFSVPQANGNRSEFGNLTLIKPSLLRDSRVHCLPSPQVPELQMPRIMIEVLVAAPEQDIVLFNTHLAFHSSEERLAQIEALNGLRDQLILKATPEIQPGIWGPYCYANPCSEVILCGDLNIDSESDAFREAVTDRHWIDCWDAYLQNSDDKASPRQPTCGCFDSVQWPEGPHVRDYFLATKNIAKHTKQLSVDVMTDSSDHQPVLLELNL